jgi:hypothetical protein
MSGSATNSAMALFVTTLFHARTQLHQLHLHTKSYAMHIALDELYKGIIEPVDAAAEAYQAQYGLIEWSAVKCPTISSGTEAQFVGNLVKFVNEQRKSLPQDRGFTALIDDIENELNGSLYKIKLLS